MPDPPMMHAGWLRTGDGPWVQVCCARSAAECWDLLLLRDPEARLVERMVLPRGRHPEDRRPR